MNFRNYILTSTILLNAVIACGQTIPVKKPINNVATDTAVVKKVLSTGSISAAYGYRVQVFFGNDRKIAYFQQAKFKALYPELNAYVTYTQPNYRVKVGDFRTRTEAQQIIAKLRPDFPNLFIFNERINAIKANETHAD